MANPNPEVYGTQETWANCVLFYTVGSGDIATRTIKPQIQVWDSASLERRKGTLSRAITAGKLTAGVPIDPTICPCGQDPTVSCFGKIGLFKNHSNSDANKIPDKIVSYTNPVNWFFAEIWRYDDGRAFTPQRTDRNSNICRWSPEGDLSNGNNQNRYVSPFVYYQLKSIFASIYVNTITGYDIYGTPDHAQMTLEAWKNNYPTRKIDSAVIRLKGVTSQTGGTIAYTSGNLDPQLSVGVSLLNDIDGIVDYYTYYEDRQQYFRLFGGLSANAYNTTDTYYMLGYDMFENAEVKSVFEAGQTQGGWSVWQEIPYSETNYEKILKMAACFGIPFSPTSKESFAAEFTDNDLYLPVIDENGIAHGEYTHGLRNVANSLYDMDGVRDIDYDPTKPQGNTYTDHTDLPSLTWTAANFYSDKTLGTTEPRINIGALCQSITELADNPSNKDFIFQEPMKNILEYRRILLTQPWERASTSEPIPLGAFQATNFVGFKNFPRYRRVTLGSFRFDREFGNFLDFEPHSQAVLYVPFCGVKQLPMNVFAGHQVNIYMNVDNTSGMLQPLIFVDNIEWGTMSGMASEELPLVGETALTAANTKRQLDYQQGQLEWAKIIGMSGSVAGASISAANKNPVGVLSQGLSAVFKNYMYRGQQNELQYQINHTKPEPLTIQKGDSSIDKMNVQYPFIMIQSPVLIGAETPEEINSLFENYGKTKGFSCCEVGPLGNFSGLTKCATADLSGISCTYTEKRMIMEALQEGVIL